MHKVYYTLIDSNPLTSSLRCVLDLLYNLFHHHHHHHHHHFICPIMQQYAHLHRYNFRRARQQCPTRTLTAAPKTCSKAVAVVQQLARFWLAHCVARSFYGSRASCLHLCLYIGLYAPAVAWTDVHLIVHGNRVSVENFFRVGRWKVLRHSVQLSPAERVHSSCRFLAVNRLVSVQRHDAHRLVRWRRRRCITNRRSCNFLRLVPLENKTDALDRGARSVRPRYCCVTVTVAYRPAVLPTRTKLLELAATWHSQNHSY